MRGDIKRPSYVAANIIDQHGEIKYHLIPGRWVKVGSVIFLMFLLLAIFLGLMILVNRLEIEDLRQKIEVQECCNADSPNTNRQ